VLWAGPLRNWCFQLGNMREERSGFEECFISGAGAEVTPVSEAGSYTFTPGAMSRALIDDYSAEVRPKQKAA
jgi:branched-chain amino acid aminotransferase